MSSAKAAVRQAARAESGRRRRLMALLTQKVPKGTANIKSARRKQERNTIKKSGRGGTLHKKLFGRRTDKKR
jgi:hypothetical protein